LYVGNIVYILLSPCQKKDSYRYLLLELRHAFDPGPLKIVV